MPAAFRLTTLGGLTLRCDGAPYGGPAAQRRRLAILAVVASGGAQGVRRDKVLSLFWPDVDDLNARHALEQALSQMRVQPANERLVVGQSALQLNAGVVTSDVADFAAAELPERAVALYAGPFLDGFRMPDAPEFERWAEEERGRLAALHARWLDALAQRAETAGDAAGAVPWLSRLAAAQPLSDVVSERLVRALAASGDRARALDYARVYAARLRAELGTSPSARFAQLVAQVRSAHLADSPAAPAAASAAITGSWATPDRQARRQAHARARLLRVLGGRYDLGALLADGSVIARYAAYDREGGLRVEVHAVQPEVARFADPDAFVRALRPVVSLADRHVVPVLDVGAADDVFFYVTGPADGEPLDERLRRVGAFPVDEAVRVAGDVAAGLAAAHARGVLHLDVRPKHITCGAAGAALAAAGVVMAVQGGAAGGDSAAPDGPRSALVTLGEATYLSPEQVGAAGLPGARSDVYALGTVLFEMLAGQPPFGRQRLTAVRKAVEPPPSVRAFRDSVPAALDGVVARCLARVPADRYASAAELRAALADAAGAVAAAG